MVDFPEGHFTPPIDVMDEFGADPIIADDSKLLKIITLFFITLVDHVLL